MKWILYPLAISLMVNTALAWGPEGHRIVAQIAQNKLTPKARSVVYSLLRGQTLPQVANWADTIKGQSQWAHTKPWHFVDIPDGQDYDHNHHVPEGDAIVAITQMVKILKSRSSSMLDKQTALMFIVHFVGDLHQPLHVGRPDDHGGNSILVVYRGQNTNLHALWDGGMIRSQNRSEADYVRYLESLDRMALANYDIPEFPFSLVVKEDMALRKEIYNFRSVQAPILITPAYVSRNMNAMNLRLLTGGKRLAVMLNMIFK